MSKPSGTDEEVVDMGSASEKSGRKHAHDKDDSESEMEGEKKKKKKQRGRQARRRKKRKRPLRRTGIMATQHPPQGPQEHCHVKALPIQSRLPVLAAHHIVNSRSSWISPTHCCHRSCHLS